MPKPLVQILGTEENIVDGSHNYAKPVSSFQGFPILSIGPFLPVRLPLHIILYPLATSSFNTSPLFWAGVAMCHVGHLMPSQEPTISIRSKLIQISLERVGLVAARLMNDSLLE